jgi:predicted amidohydrolase YtcJ
MLASSCEEGEPMPATALPDRADLIFTGGRVHTVNKQNDIAEAVAVGGGRILTVGSGANVLALAGGDAAVELRGRSLLPGFTDAHAHFVGVGRRRRQSTA